MKLLHHLIRSTEAKDSKNPNKVKCDDRTDGPTDRRTDGPTDRWTDGPTKRDVELRSTRLKRKERNLLFAFVFTDSVGNDGGGWEKKYKAEYTNGLLGRVDSAVGRGSRLRQWAGRKQGT